MSVRNLSGRWTLDKALSTKAEETMQAQGVSYLIRKTVGLSKVILDIEHKGLELKVTYTTSSMRTSSHELRKLDWSEVENKIAMFGLVRGRSRIAELGGNGDHKIQVYDLRDNEPSPEQAEDLDWLGEGWLCEDEGAAAKAIHVIETQGECPEGGWASHQVWGFQMVDGQRKHVRKVLTWTKKDGKKVLGTMVYDRIEE
nr:hypothetical protein CFP56_11539 [Quercus suber]